MALPKKLYAYIHHYEIDTRLKRPVVIKIVYPRRAKEKQVSQQILEEAQIASAILHPNISTIYEAGEFEGCPYIIMQYVPGRTLAELLEKGSLNPNTHFYELLKGYLFYSEQAYEEAILVLESAIEENPNYQVTYPTLAMCFVKNNQPDKAHSLITDDY